MHGGSAALHTEDVTH